MSFTLWFVGLPSCGKSTVARRVETKLQQRGFKVENLDGDNVRQNLHPELGFSKEDRGTNNRRIGFICKLLNKNDVVAIVAAIAPYREYREKVRDMVEEAGKFVLIYVECPVEVCKSRDPKGLYEKAEQGAIENFTGVNDPFEEPQQDKSITRLRSTPRSSRSNRVRKW
jgi:adenylylsulfate kinase